MNGKITFFIKKDIEAESLADAIAREHEGRIIEVYKQESEPKSTDAVGFTVPTEQGLA